MLKAPLCFDKFVISNQNLDTITNSENFNNIPSCSGNRKGVAMTRDTKIEMDDGGVKNGTKNYNIKNNCVPKNLQCGSNNIYNINSENQLYNYIDGKTTMYSSTEQSYSNLISDLRPFFSILNDSNGMHLWNTRKTEDKNKWKGKLKYILRQIISLENDNEMVDLKLQKLYNTTTTTRSSYSSFITDFKKENKRNNTFRENKDEELLRRDESYHSISFAGYNNMFYLLLIFISIRFLQSQLK
tara:strand:- start:734 stop:1459 length:726 start_codon:yes stop_codon:yes gene_type:complete